MTAVGSQPGCADAREPGLLSVAQARDRVLSLTRPVEGFEQLAIRSALGRVLYRDVRANFDVPPHTNSAMDGYAVRASDLPPQGVRDYRLVGSAYAGRPFAGAVGEGECVRVMTGAPIPAGTDTVVMQEQAQVLGNCVRIGGGHRAGQNVRQAGEDLSTGEIMLGRGSRIGAAELGMLASEGITEVRVYRRPRVAFFSTGDELRSLGEALGPGEIYDSNRYTLFGMLSESGVALRDMGVVRDRRRDILAAFRQAAAEADLVITTGGVSVGEADYVHEALETLGQIDFWKVAMKPGRPLAFGPLGEALFFGLPGNPVAAMVTFDQFVKPALSRLKGELSSPRLRLRAHCTSTLRKRVGRTEFVRGLLEPDGEGQWRVKSAGPQGSGRLSSMSRANCLIILPAEVETVESGSEVQVEPFT